ncbi:thioredoxin-like protein [Stachybotrys elegans]|uniref:Thioredoxin-like protein n=1 Tax=Stachybotrys elegans TaxID=80388 RepID=A0A8K0SNM2_9HYPO|nr:thioredoxin-like protein [Stachybotrys elegans]
MALPPKFAGHKLVFATPSPSSSSSVPTATHTLELYLDYCCPFSAKLFRTLTETVAPEIRANPAWAQNLAVVFRQQVQPWHPSSTLMHEAGLAVLRLDPSKFWDFSAALFADQAAFFDVNVVNETRNKTYKRLAAVAAKVGLDENEVYKLLEIAEKPAEDGSLNVGNQVTVDLKLVTKMNRLIGVHVTPTGVLDGVVHDLGSSWTLDQWKEWLSKNIV